MLVGRGAWQDWSYEVEVINSRTNRTLTLRHERDTGVSVSGLLPSCVYNVRVRAQSTEGSGPWSTDFTAQTLSAGTAASAKAVVSLPWSVVCLSTGRVTFDKRLCVCLGRLVGWLGCQQISQQVKQK